MHTHRSIDIKKYKFNNWSQPVFTDSKLNSGDVWYKLHWSTYNGSYYPWLAFNNNTTKNNDCWFTGSVVISESAPQWICMECEYPLKLTQVSIMNEKASPVNFKTGYVQASNNFSSWTNLATLTGVNTASKVITATMAPTQGYRFYRLYFTSSFASGSKGVSLQNIVFTGQIQREVTTAEYNVCTIHDSYRA